MTVTACEKEQGAGKYVSKEGSNIAVFLAVRSRLGSVTFATYLHGQEAPSAAYLRLTPFPILTQSYRQPQRYPQPGTVCGFVYFPCNDENGCSAVTKGAF